jgi:hypothetical protein
VDAFSEIFELDGVNVRAAKVADHMRDVIGEWSVQGSAYVADIKACFKTLLGALKDWDTPRYYTVSNGVEKEVKSMPDAKVIWTADGGEIGLLAVKGYGSTTSAHADMPDTITKRAIAYDAHIMVQTEKRSAAANATLDEFHFASGDGRVTVDDGLLDPNIDLSGWKAMENFRDVMAHARDRGDHVNIRLGDDVLVIADTHKADLHRGDFVF